jgi:hypothetical protein
VGLVPYHQRHAQPLPRLHPQKRLIGTMVVAPRHCPTGTMSQLLLLLLLLLAVVVAVCTEVGRMDESPPPNPGTGSLAGLGEGREEQVGRVAHHKAPRRQAAREAPCTVRRATRVVCHGLWAGLR